MSRIPRKRPLRVKDLEIIVPLTRGGMGEVWLARRTGMYGFDRIVAVKLIRSELASDENLRHMFVDEARVLSQLSHPVVAQVYEFGEKYGTLYLTMEYVPGLSMSRFMARRGRPIDPAVAARMIADIARGLHAVHEQKDEAGQPLNIVHRDVSPQNIMMSFDGQMKLIDFGIALIVERSVDSTNVGMVKGKISYVSPEQIAGLDVDRRSDVYSLCVVLHELLTGQVLFEPRSNAIEAAKDRQRPTKPSKRVKVPKQLERIVMKGLSANPAKRWQDSREMALALEEFSTKYGAPSLASFAETELEKDRVAHQTWLQSLATTIASEIQPPPTELLEEEEMGIEVSSSSIVHLEQEYSEGIDLEVVIIAALAIISLVSGAVMLFWGKELAPLMSNLLGG